MAVKMLSVKMLFVKINMFFPDRSFMCALAVPMHKRSLRRTRSISVYVSVLTMAPDIPTLWNHQANCRHNDYYKASCVFIADQWYMMPCSWLDHIFAPADLVSPLFVMMASSNGNIFRVTGPCAGNSPVTGESPLQRPMTELWCFFDLCLNKRLSKK